MLCESEEKTLHKSDEKYQAYVKILEEELVPAMGCTEPIAIAYAGAVARKTLGNLPEQLDIKISGNIIKNVKSVIVPNTGGMRGIAAALCAGVIAGDAEALLEVIARVTSGQKEEIKSYMDQVKPRITPASTGHVFEIDLTVTKGTETARVRIVDTHTNIILNQQRRRLDADDGRAALSQSLHLCCLQSAPDNMASAFRNAGCHPQIRFLLHV